MNILRVETHNFRIVPLLRSICLWVFLSGCCHYLISQPGDSTQFSSEDPQPWVNPPGSGYSRIDIRYDVDLVAQTSHMSCWAAATAMIVGWRDLVVLRPEEIANGVGYWAQYHNVNYSGEYFEHQGLPPDDLNMFEVWGLVPEVRIELDLEDFAQLLYNYGPLWVASGEDLTGSGRAAAHIRVITGMAGDGTPDGTVLYINDPWDRRATSFTSRNQGSAYSEIFSEFLQKQQVIQERELEANPNAIYVAHP